MGGEGYGEPVFDLLDDQFLTERVIVRKESEAYWGYVRMWNYHEPSIFLEGAVRIAAEEDDDEYVGSLYIQQPDTVETDGQVSPVIEELPVSAARPSPYTQRGFDDTDFDLYVRQVRKNGHLARSPQSAKSGMNTRS